MEIAKKRGGATLNRFITAQKDTYPIALKEIRNGQKESCWMWFIFPQIDGLGYSDISKYYAIKDRAEAEAYLKHPILGKRLRTITKALLKLKSNDPVEVMGWIDDQKLQASMTLFYLVSGEKLFKDVLDKYFNGELDSFTIGKLQEEI